MTRKDVERLVIGMLMAWAWWGCEDNLYQQYFRPDSEVRHISAAEAYNMANSCVLLYACSAESHRIAHIIGDIKWRLGQGIAARYPGKTFIVYGPSCTAYVARWLPKVVIMDGGIEEWREAGFQVAEDTTYARRVRWEEQWQREMNNWWWGGPPPSWIRADGGAR